MGLFIPTLLFSSSEYRPTLLSIDSNAHWWVLMASDFLVSGVDIVMFMSISAGCLEVCVGVGNSCVRLSVSFFCIVHQDLSMGIAQ